MIDTVESRKYKLLTCFSVSSLNKVHKKERRLRYVLLIFIIVVLGIVSFVFLFSALHRSKKIELAEEVLQYQPMIEEYAAKYEIREYVPYLLAIMQVESGGQGEDVMQCSESLGLEPNSLKTEKSIEQGCRYFSELVQIAEQNGCDTDAVVQAYNYGIGYLHYIAENGHRHTLGLAEQFAKNYSGNKKVEYNNPIAVSQNGGWRYGYGNMFYTILVQQYILECV